MASESLKNVLLLLVNSTLEWIWPLILIFNFVTILPLLFVLRTAKYLFTMPLEMKNKVVLVTGASSGIGQHIAYEYAKLGARLALTARREDKLEKVAEDCRKMGSKDVITFNEDQGDEDACIKVVDGVMQHFGRLDALVLNASVWQVGAFEEYERVSNAHQVMDVNFWGYLYFTQHALPHLRKSGGQIVVNDSVAAFLPQPKNSMYNASKGAVSQFFETLRVELGHSVVPITMFLPGVVKSEMTDGKGIQADGELPTTYEMTVQRRGEAAMGLFPVYPTYALARRAVKAARYRQQRVVIPAWYNMMLYFQHLAPELFQAQLWTMFAGKDSIVKETSKVLGGGIKAPGKREVTMQGYTKEE